ncbi:unknown [[Mannheimia] succiniciproducens MBEL55E]|uniref:Uncharacterized protein n=1 Tax=Mannheimia succiniciproducens (strain KCTC 0769BP / MBEL55E) TaxID=221988 RepID=Q65RG1_MANSM|nr:unknown [[Mannheimia] succiniciproducens MBEL55E]
MSMSKYLAQNFQIFNRTFMFKKIVQWLLSS